MYDRFFGLAKRPFNLTPDPAFLFLTPQHREALVGLTYAILQRKGFVVLTGEAGTGKTTLLAKVLQSLPANRLQFGVILNPTLTASEFLEMALLDFGITDIPSSKARRLWTLQNFLFQGRQQGKVSALIVDEAHKLSPEVLEEIRLLGNFEEAEHKLLQILLVGQGELEQSLDRDDLRQLKQRIALWLQIHPLSVAEVGDYIRHRWEAAGGKEPPFSDEAISCIAQASKGIPRVISSLCDNGLTLAFAEGKSEVGYPDVITAATDMKISGIAHMSVEVTRELAPTGSTDYEPDAGAREVNFDILNGAGRPSLWTKWAGKLRLAAKHESP